MSYILDAIRKSDLQRQRGAAPTLLTSHEAAAAPRRPASLFYALLALALLAAGIAIGWLRPWQTPATLPAQDDLRAAARGSLPAPATALPAAPLEPARRYEREAAPAKPVPGPPVSAATAPATTGVAPGVATRPVASAPVPTVVATPAPGQTVAAPDKAAADASGEQKTLTYAELPFAIQQEIPRLSISVHAYSSQPRNRLVTIDNRLLHEGDAAAPGLTLEQITPDGMVFSYKGHRFRRSVQEIVNNR